MGKKDQTQNDKDKVEAVLDLLKKQAPLTLKQEKLCNSECVERFLKCKGENVKKAAKQLRNYLSWRDSIGIGHLMADEFSAELYEGTAYVGGYDDESRPVMVFRFKQDYHKIHTQKKFTRLVVFTIEVAIQTMGKNVEEFVILFDASPFRSASAFMNIMLPSLKILSDYYPGLLYKAFVIDPPSLFSYIWKGMRPFLELSSLTVVVNSLEFEDSLDFNFKSFKSYPRASSLRFDPSSTAKIGSCSSSRFAFTVSHHIDSLKPWSLTLTDTSSSKVGHTSSSSVSLMGPSLISPLNARSYSFASPIGRAPLGSIHTVKRSFFPSTPMPQKTKNLDVLNINHPRTPNPSFFQSPASFFKRDYHVTKVEKTRESFAPYLKFYRWPYDEMTYRSKMRPPLGGLISIIPQMKRRHTSISQRF